VRQGDPARGAYILREGSADAIVWLPGGEKLTVASLGPGSVVGEMALIELGTCTATLRATAPISGWFVAHEDFRALVSQASPAALRLQHAVTSILADKVAALNVQLLGCAAAEDRPARAAPAGVDPLAGVPRLERASFDTRPFLQRLPVFEHFMADEIDEVAGRGRYLELARGDGLFAAGTPAAAAFIVIRGAAEVVAMRGELERRIAVLGPGQLVGQLSVLRKTPHSTHAFAREASTILEIEAADFHDLYFGSSRASARLRQAVQVSLLASMARTNRALTRLISHARLATARHDEATLEAARASLIATASPV
jgi:CRP-like cAMP-binding protein